MNAVVVQIEAKRGPVAVAQRQRRLALALVVAPDQLVESDHAVGGGDVAQQSWGEMEVPEPMRTHWVALVEATLHAPIATDSERHRRDEDTRRTALDVVKHADSTFGA